MENLKLMMILAGGYHDQQGNAMQINRDDVSQIIER